MKNFILISIILLYNNLTYAQTKELGTEANDAIYFLSLCSKQMGEEVKPGYWIGKVERIDTAPDFSYVYYIFRTKGFTTVPVGALTLKATAVISPPADGSGLSYFCNFKSN